MKAALILPNEWYTPGAKIGLELLGVSEEADVIWWGVGDVEDLVAIKRRDVTVYAWPDAGQMLDQNWAYRDWLVTVGSNLPKLWVLCPDTLPQYPNDLDSDTDFGTAVSEALPYGTTKPKAEYARISNGNLTELGTRLAAPLDVIPTPFPTWNKNCRGFGGREGIAKGWYVVIGGKSGKGKTHLANNLGVHAAIAGRTVAFHSFEMEWDALALRNLTLLSGEPGWKLEPGKHFDPTAYARAVERAEGLGGDRIHLNRKRIRKLGELVDGLKYFTEVHGAELHIIDYLQLVSGSDYENALKQITTTSNTIQGLTGQLGIRTIALSQLNRAATADITRRPQKEDLFGGTPLEADSDQVIIFDHSRWEKTPEGWNTWCLLDKNRHGPECDIPIAFNSDSFAIRERMDDELTTADEKKPHNGGRRKQ